MTETNQLTLSEKNKEIAKKLNSQVFSVLGQTAMEGFEKAYLIAEAIDNLKTLLSPEYMKPIMALQGQKLGFKTDKDRSGGYSEAIVKECLIDAVLIGLQPYNNQFNIISGNMYPTKEGCGELLSQIKGLENTIVCGLPKINADKTGAAVDVTITWSMNRGETKEKVIPIPIKIDQYSSVDAIIGKATRKGRMWLINTLTGFELTDGDAEETAAEVISSRPLNSTAGETATNGAKSKAEKSDKKVSPEEAKANQEALDNLTNKSKGEDPTKLV